MPMKKKGVLIMDDILGPILAIIVFILFIGFLVFCLIGLYQQEKETQEYIKTLNEHDKSIVLDYINLSKRFFPRFRKGVKK